MKTLLEKNIPRLEASQQFAQELYDKFLKDEKNFTLFFEGGLGAGKTFLIREILKCFGVQSEIASPTYIFLSEYETDRGAFAHFDFYRFTDPGEFFARGFAEVAEDESICKFVEWPEKLTPEIKKSFSGKTYTIQIQYGVGVGMRKVKVF